MISLTAVYLLHLFTKCHTPSKRERNQVAFGNEEILKQWVHMQHASTGENLATKYFPNVTFLKSPTKDRRASKLFVKRAQELKPTISILLNIVLYIMALAAYRWFNFKPRGQQL